MYFPSFHSCSPKPACSKISSISWSRPSFRKPWIWSIMTRYFWGYHQIDGRTSEATKWCSARFWTNCRMAFKNKGNLSSTFSKAREATDFRVCWFWCLSFLFAAQNQADDEVPRISKPAYENLINHLSTSMHTQLAALWEELVSTFCLFFSPHWW